jgi:hypothetical protein
LQISKGIVVGAAGQYLPQASNMHQLTWNEELATEAQKWANQCILKTDNSVGQNVFFQGSNREVPGDPFETAINDWFIESVYFSFPTSSPGWMENLSLNQQNLIHNTKHFSTMSWADTNQVGCGLITMIGNDS